MEIQSMAEAKIQVDSGKPVGHSCRPVIQHIWVPLLFAVMVYPFVHRNVLGEPDLTRMVSAILYDHITGAGLNDSDHYGLSFSFGFYHLANLLLPSESFGDTSRLIRTLNLAGFVAAVLALITMSLGMCLAYGRRTALVVTIIVAFSPVYLELATSCHPLLPALALFFLGAYAMFLADTLPSAQRVAVLVAAGTALLGALTVRADVILAFPWIAVTYASHKELRQELRPIAVGFAQRALLLAGVFGTFLLLQQQYVSPSQGSAGTLASFLGTFWNPDLLLKGIVLLILGSGIVASLAIGLSIVFVWRRRKSKEIGYALWLSTPLVLAIPTLVFWLPNPVPARHLIFATVGGAIVVGMAWNLLSRVASVAGAVAIAVGIVSANQLVAEVARIPISNRYVFAYPQVGERPAPNAVPLGYAWRHHCALERRYEALRQEGIEFANWHDPAIVAFAEDKYYLMIGLLEERSRRHISDVEISKTDLAGLETLVVRRGGEVSYLVEKSMFDKKDVVKEVLNSQQLPDAELYFQELTRTEYDQTPLPKQRAVHLPTDPFRSRQLEGVCGFIRG